MRSDNTYSSVQTTGLVVLRMLIGWHFLYEGIVKVLSPKWTSYGYLMDTKGIFQSLFQSLAENQAVLSVVDFMNEWGLLLIGLSLVAGCFARIASIAAMILLGTYYLSHPPFIGANYMMPTEGNYLWVDKNLIEIAALFVLYLFPTSQCVGLDKYIFKTKK